MVNNLTNIIKTNNHLSPQLLEYKTDHDMCWWKSKSWFETDTKIWQL